ncbi:hypothetical protein CMO91_02455 [Candidatus Woesearchaeota archaeon]|nr:hypothetical protein [Candidatus Woesearchaeota archaeon]
METTDCVNQQYLRQQEKKQEELIKTFLVHDVKKAYTDWTEAHHGREIDIKISDSTAPGDVATGINTKLFPNCTRRFISKAIHSPIKIQQPNPENPVIITDGIPCDGNLLTGQVKYLREEGYENIWLMYAMGSGGTLFVYNFSRVFDRDFVKDFPRPEILPVTMDNSMITNEIGPGAVVEPCFIERIPMPAYWKA